MAFRVGRIACCRFRQCLFSRAPNVICAALSARKSRSCQSKALRYSRSFKAVLGKAAFRSAAFLIGGGRPVSGALISRYAEDLLGSAVRDVGLLAQKAIALCFRDDDDPDRWHPFD